MATDTEMITTKTVTELDEKTTPVDADLFVAGDAGSALLKKFKWSSLLSDIKTKIAEWVFDTLTTKDKTLPGALNELNSKMDQNNSGYFSLGDNGLKIVWGTIDFESVPSGSHSAITATFPVKFKAEPKVFASMEGGLAMIPIVFGKTTQDCTIWLYNLKENSATTNRHVSYLAIGY